MDTERNSLHSISIPTSIRNETKSKFDELLSTALKHKKNRKDLSKSKELLLAENDSTTASSTNLLDDKLCQEVKPNTKELNKPYYENENFILDKFLNDSSTVQDENDSDKTYVKVPVPKPRKKIPGRKSSNASAQTFKVTSPKILKNDSNLSQETYVVETNNTNQIGDLLLHNSPINAKIQVVSNTNLDLEEKNDIEYLIDNHSKSSLSTSITVSSHDKNDEKNIPLEVISKSITKKSTDNETIKYSYEKIVEITIHKTDRLLLKTFIIHPVVQIHVVNVNTGKYYLKSQKNRSVVFFYENDNLEYILPFMTRSYSLQEYRTLMPQWEEKIVLNEDSTHFLNENLILFFEILDFTTSTNQKNYNKKFSKGWRPVAYAFFKPVGKHSNMNKKVRLQLYYPSPAASDKNAQHCSLWDWWKNRRWVKYPSSLYITIKEIISPDKIIHTLRSKTPLEAEKSTTYIYNPDDVTIEENGSHVENLCNVDSRDNNTGKSDVSLPGKCIGKFATFDEGCLLHKFSNDGSYIACAVRIDEMYCIVVYSVKSSEEVEKFACHQGLIYSVNWSKNDKLIITSSADNTTSIWNFKNKSFLQVLPHPCYVYANDIHEESTVVTGSYDGVVRLWNFGPSNKFVLAQELEKHKSYVTSVVINKSCTSIYSADSVGVVIEWNKTDDWMFSRHIQLPEIQGVVINQLLLFPNGKKLLIHSRDSTLRIVSLKNGFVLHWLQGALNRRVQTFCSISGCGDFVVAGAENGLVSIWNAKTGAHVATFNPYSNNSVVINCCQFHPFSDTISVSHYGQNLPLLLYDGNNEKSENTVVKDPEHGRLALNKFTLKRARDKGENLSYLKDLIQKMDEMFQ